MNRFAALTAALALTAIVISNTPLASAETAGDESKLNERKQEFSANLDQRIANLQKAKNCATAAQTGEALRACRDTLHTEQKALGEDMKEKHKTKIDSRIEKLKERRSKMDQKRE